MLKCYNCGKPAMYLVGPEGKEVPLCLDCNLKHTQMLAIENEQLERQLNYLADEMEFAIGLPGMLPRYPKRQVRILQADKIVLNNIRVSESNIGVLNTGNLEIVDSAITVLKQDTTTREISDAVSKLANAIAKSNELSPEKKNEALEILGVIASEATIPKERRKNNVIRTLLSAFPTAIQTAASVIQIWQTVEPIIKTFFQ